MFIEQHRANHNPFLKCRGFPCREDLELKLKDLRAYLPIYGRYKCVVGSLNMVCNLFPCRDT